MAITGQGKFSISRTSWRSGSSQPSGSLRDSGSSDTSWPDENTLTRSEGASGHPPRQAGRAITPAKLGVPYNVGGLLTLLNATGLRTAKEMIFTARPIDAIRAERHGLINTVAPAAEIEAFTLELAKQIVENAPLSVAVIKEQLRILGGAHTMSPQGFECIQGLRRVVYDSQDYQEGILAFKEKRRLVFRGE
jgi:methylmalonyl-CoA decarboxylase